MFIVHSVYLVAICSVVTHATERQIPSSYLNVVLNTQRLLLSKHKADDLPKIPAAFLRRLSGDYILDTVEDVLNSGVLQGAESQGAVPSSICLNHIVLFLEGVLQQQRWALSMVDAAGKPGNWLYGGEINWVGSYQECNRIVAKLNVTDVDNDTSVITPFLGQYCTAVVPLQPSDARPPIPGTPTTGVRIGLCLPDTCTGSDITAILNSILISQNTSIRVFPTICQARKLDYDTKAIAVLCVISLIVLMMIAGTAYDVIHIQMPRWANKQEETSTMHVADNEEIPHLVTIDKTDEQTPLIPKEDTRDSEEYEPGRLGKALLAFSVYTNGKKILSTTHSKDSIQCLHGIRFISMTWIILGHTIAFGISVAKNLKTFSQDAVQDWTFQAIINATVAVDTFFAFSGLLVTYLILKEMKKNRGRINWFMFYFHRFWRLTPAYMLVIMVYVPLFRYWGEGPQWPQTGIEYTDCDHWWTNLLYINNLVEPLKICMGWSWYLSNDMQFYVLSPLIFVPFFYNMILGSISLLAFLLATLITSGVLSNVNNYPAGGSQAGIQIDFFKDFYVKPYVRMGPYLVGMATGYLLYKTQCKVKISKVDM
ncbi:nose resistant to fluoxetine protein 6-like isoform X2 [Gigantopelta aegis]|uniref:nose resistant to fluoxetine protein 6-like isoform X2 n=1 Tax=Gigantopelta aegis TaxID=1735272 RepID=UPI001B88D116|nr:nose resistant to fluoxetine protein 6-like isoform X2 [Gigantopelta aegis]